MATDAFPDKRFSERCYTHELDKLFGVAGSEASFQAARQVDPALRISWEELEKWSEHARYKRIDEAEARALYEAVVDPAHGLWSWIRTHW